MQDYKIHFDGMQYWIGKVVRDQQTGQALFVQQVGDYTPYKRVATRWLKDIEKQLNTVTA